jgi:hypothetical protein
VRQSRAGLVLLKKRRPVVDMITTRKRPVKKMTSCLELVSMIIRTFWSSSALNQRSTLDVIFAQTDTF